MAMLLHCCCGPCTLEVADYWVNRGEAVHLWFFNPNLQPEEERRRRQTFRTAAEAVGISASTGEGVTGVSVLLALARARGRRCHACYRLRLEAAARHAREQGCAAFSTTLVVSPYQDLPALQRIGEEIGRRLGVRFAFADLRHRYPASRERAKALGLYRQNYCGCLFSRLERAERRAQRAIERSVGRTASGADPPGPRAGTP